MFSSLGGKRLNTNCQFATIYMQKAHGYCSKPKKSYYSLSSRGTVGLLSDDDRQIIGDGKLIEKLFG